VSVKMSRIIEVMEELAPLHLVEDWDNAGFLAGRHDANIDKALIALDALDAVIDEALELNAKAIITHHPIIFYPVSRINNSSAEGKRLLRIIENGINVYCAHSNLDNAIGGINDMLFDIFELKDKELVCEGRPGVFAGRAGTPKEQIALKDFAKFIQGKLNLLSAVYCGPENSIVRKVGVISGGTAKMTFFKGMLAAGCDTFITSEIKLDKAQAAMDMNLNLVDATHYGGEVIFAPKLKEYLEPKLPGLELIVSQIDGQFIKTT